MVGALYCVCGGLCAVQVCGKRGLCTLEEGLSVCVEGGLCAEWEGVLYSQGGTLHCVGEFCTVGVGARYSVGGLCAPAL